MKVWIMRLCNLKGKEDDIIGVFSTWEKAVAECDMLEKRRVIVSIEDFEVE
jgi:hypothetical protein